MGWGRLSFAALFFCCCHRERCLLRLRSAFVSALPGDHGAGHAVAIIFAMASFIPR